MSSGLFKNNVTYKLFAYKSYMIYIYQDDLALNNLQGLIWHKTQPNQTYMCVWAASGVIVMIIENESGI